MSVLVVKYMVGNAVFRSQNARGLLRTEKSGLLRFEIVVHRCTLGYLMYMRCSKQCRLCLLEIFAVLDIPL